MTVSFSRSRLVVFVSFLASFVGAPAMAADNPYAALFAAPGGIAAGVPAPLLKTDLAEVCTSMDGRQQLVRRFGSENAAYFSVARTPGAKPVIKDKHTYKKSVAGVATKNPMEFVMFEIIAETFDPQKIGPISRPKDQWKATFEELYQGPITIIDENNQPVGTVPMSCNGVSIDFK